MVHEYIHQLAHPQLQAWYLLLAPNMGAGKGPNDVKTRYPSASFLAGNRIVFNIKGNQYRIVVDVKYEYFTVYIRLIGTHDEYNKIDATTI